MKILIASSEVHPYSKTGGLADMTGALGKALAKAGHEAGIVTPLYRGIREMFPELQRLDYQMHLQLGNVRFSAEVWEHQAANRLRIYFIRQEDFFYREALYQDRTGGFGDNAERFMFFCKAVVHLARYLPWRPDVIHAHDWQTGFVPLLVKQQHDQEHWNDAPATCFTIHNLASQGVFRAEKFALANLPWDYFRPEGVEFYGQVNFLKSALVFSDRLATVSPRYARQITTEEFGCGLDGVLRKRQSDLAGILNGVDYDEWSPKDDAYLRCTYSADDPSGKSLNKAALQKEVGLAVDPAIPVFGSVSRLADQKGSDIQLRALEQMLSSETPPVMQFVLLGAGARDLERGYRKLAERFRAKVAALFGYTPGLSHRIEAGADFFLMPSRFEPCGLNQMYSLRYGTIPIVRATGGLDDSVIDPVENVALANGLKFSDYSSEAISRAVRKAILLFEYPGLLDHFRNNGMRADFSWTKAAAEYSRSYQESIRSHSHQIRKSN
jgi:starch synthase